MPFFNLEAQKLNALVAYSQGKSAKVQDESRYLQTLFGKIYHLSLKYRKEHYVGQTWSLRVVGNTLETTERVDFYSEQGNWYVQAIGAQGQLLFSPKQFKSFLIQRI